ncbi:MAG: T9SS type A sorting domain-containing protein [candidate division WOR-3 bacterium]
MIRVRVPLSVKEIRIFDVSGKLIRAIATPSAHTDNEIKISLKGIKSGIYFLQLGTETKKFLVTR